MNWITVVGIMNVVVYWIGALILFRSQKSAKLVSEEEKPNSGSAGILCVILGLVFGAIVILMGTDFAGQGKEHLTYLNLAVLVLMLETTAFGLLFALLSDVRESVNFPNYFGWEVSYDNVRLILGLPVNRKIRAYEAVHYVGGFRCRNISGNNCRTGLKISVVADFYPADRGGQDPIIQFQEYNGLVDNVVSEIQYELDGLANSIDAKNLFEVGPEDETRIAKWRASFKPDLNPSNKISVRIRKGDNGPLITFDDPKPIRIIS